MLKYLKYKVLIIIIEISCWAGEFISSLKKNETERKQKKIFHWCLVKRNVNTTRKRLIFDGIFDGKSVYFDGNYINQKTTGRYDHFDQFDKNTDKKILMGWQSVNMILAEIWQTDSLSKCFLTQILMEKMAHHNPKDLRY